MKLFIRLYIFRSIWFIMTIGGLHATADSSCAQHEIFNESVIQKWKEYEVFSHSLQGTVRSQRTRNGKQEESIYRFKQNRECALAIGPHNRDPLLLRCSLANPHYMAIINLSKSNPNNVVLQNYMSLPGETEYLSPIDFAFIETSRHFYYGNKSLRQTVSDSSFKVTKVAKENQNGQELVRVDHIYNYVIHRPNNEFHVQLHGSLWFDPLRCWCIRRSMSSNEATIRGERSSKTEREFESETIDHPSGFPILKSITEHVKTINYKNNQTIDGTSKIDYELEVNDNVPDTEFTLTAFGLPEPGGGPVKKSMPLFVWILVAAGICAALALGFRYLARRPARSHPAA